MTIDSENDQSSYLTAYTDASYNEHTKIGGWAVVMINQRGRNSIKYGALTEGKYIDRDIVGMEMFAIREAIKFAGYDARLKIYTDNIAAVLSLNDILDDDNPMNNLRISIHNLIDSQHAYVTVEHAPRNSNVWMAYADHLAMIAVKKHKPIYFPKFKEVYNKDHPLEKSIV